MTKKKKNPLSLACRCNTYLWRCLTNNRPTVSNRSSEDISSVADSAIFKNRAQNIECVARSAILLKPNVANVLLFNFCEQKFVQHGPITISIDWNGLSLLILEEKWLNYASGQLVLSNPAPTSDSFGFSVPQMRQFCLFTYPPTSKWASFEEIIFFAKTLPCWKSW